MKKLNKTSVLGFIGALGLTVSANAFGYTYANCVTKELPTVSRQSPASIGPFSIQIVMEKQGTSLLVKGAYPVVRGVKDVEYRISGAEFKWAWDLSGKMISNVRAYQGTEEPPMQVILSISQDLKGSGFVQIQDMRKGTWQGLLTCTH